MYEYKSAELGSFRAAKLGDEGWEIYGYSKYFNGIPKIAKFRRLI